MSPALEVDQPPVAESVASPMGSALGILFEPESSAMISVVRVVLEVEVVSLGAEVCVAEVVSTTVADPPAVAAESQVVEELGESEKVP